jgi:hypothetical protein
MAADLNAWTLEFARATLGCLPATRADRDRGAPGCPDYEPFLGLSEVYKRVALDITIIHLTRS